MALFTVSPGRNGQPRVLAAHAASGALLEVYLHGATVTSFVHAGQDLFFVSPLAVFDGAKAIRGGNPIIFPQFASQGPLAPHGFARVSPWALAAARDGFVELRLAPDGVAAPARVLWPHAFALTLRLTFAGAALRSELVVENTGAAPFAFDAMQHAYVALGDAALPADDGPGAAAVDWAA